jgi:predicted nucleotide-binding protein (sugar kinase/HSP70/actin superfamily)
MQDTFTQKLQALRANLDATNDARQAFLKGLHDDVHAARSDAQAFLGQLQKSHLEASQRMQAALKEDWQRRNEMRDDMRHAAQALRARHAQRS